MVTLDTLEGLIDGTWSYHYDVGGDVLYVRVAAARDVEAYGEETDDGFILLRNVETDAVVGLTVVGWWKRFGPGTDLPDSLHEFQAHVEPWAAKVAA